MNITTPVDVIDEPGLRITEYFGNVADHQSVLSACLATVTKPASEAWQTPLFDEYVLVLEGRVEIHHSGGVLQVKAGQGLFLPKLTRVKWVWPEPTKYVPICLPAFSPWNCVREDDSGVKSEEAMARLRSLHGVILHVARKDLWESCGDCYYPPTFAQDGEFTHATSDVTKLIDVLNHFYKSHDGDFVCLKMTISSLEACGVKTLFEETSPVGDTPAIDMGTQLFPHIQGGIPPNAVLDVLPVIRAKDGTFLDVPPLTTPPSNKFPYSRLLGGVATFAAGIAIGSILASRK